MVVFALVILVTVASATPVSAEPNEVVPPLEPMTVIRPFEPPPSPWLAGHRGVDLLASTGQVVRTPVAAVVSFTGVIAGRPVLVLALDSGLRTTFEPVRASVVVGESVDPGDSVGRVAAPTGHCGVISCVHWGLLEGPSYLDPLKLLYPAPRLLPVSGFAGQMTQRPLVAYLGQSTTKLQDGLGVHLADPALGDTKHLADLRKRQPLVVVQGNDDLLSFWQMVDRLGQQILRFF